MIQEFQGFDKRLLIFVGNLQDRSQDQSSGGALLFGAIRWHNSSRRNRQILMSQEDVCVCVFISWVFRGLKIMSPENHMKSQHQYPGSPLISFIFNGHSERKTLTFQYKLISSTISGGGHVFFHGPLWLPGRMTITSPSALSLVELISRERCGACWDGGPLIRCLTSPVGALWKMIYPINTHYII